MAISYNPKIVTDGLVLCLDAGNTKSYNAGISTTNWNDLSTNNRDITLNNGPTHTSTGGGYLTFNGTNQNGAFTVPTLTDYSMSFWVYIVSLPASGEEQLFSNQNDDIGISLLFTGGSWKWHSWNASGVPSGNASRVGSNVSTGIWYNFVMTRAGASTKFYTNGSLTNTFANGGDITAGNAYFCTYSTGTGRNLNARLSNICFYDRELSASEVLQNYSCFRGRFGI